MNQRGVTRPAAYVIVGVLLWIFVLKSGVHATLAGVALAFAIPMGGQKDDLHPEGHSLLHDMEHALHPWVAYAILPIFAFANAGVPLVGMSLDTLTNPLTLGIATALLWQTDGVFGASAPAIVLGLASRPANAGWTHLCGVALLCGVGFTMSLFISSPHSNRQRQLARLGIILGRLHRRCRLSASAVYGPSGSDRGCRERIPWCSMANHPRWLAPTQAGINRGSGRVNAAVVDVPGPVPCRYSRRRS